jgi:hypothetical protein
MSGWGVKVKMPEHKCARWLTPNGADTIRCALNHFKLYCGGGEECRVHDEAEAALDALVAERDSLVDALERIVALDEWREGRVSAQGIARAALAAVRVPEEAPTDE